jgi:5'-methylthioadenosine phosphorylase
MTLAPEAKLAREAEMCLCGILTVTDYDCWYEGKEDVSVRNVVENLKKNDKNMADIVKKLVPKIKYKRDCECSNAMEYAVITPLEFIEKNGNQQVNRLLLKRFIK